MTSLVIGADGLLGSALMDIVPDPIGTTRRHRRHFDDRGRPSFYLDLLEPQSHLPICDVAYLCAGTKGFAENEGNRNAFRADVDGNIQIARRALAGGSFVLFISSDGAEWGGHTAYIRNRLLVEMALVMQPRVAIIRPAKFNSQNVASLAARCLDVARARAEGVHYWHPSEGVAACTSTAA